MAVNTIPADATLLRCFAIMARLGVSGLGVTEPRGAATAGAAQAVAGRLVGSISESDLRRITPGHFDVLATTVGDFIAKLHAPAGQAPELRCEPMAAARVHPLFSGMLSEGELTGGRLSVTCAPTASLLHVMRALAYNRVHRVYAVDHHSGVGLAHLRPSILAPD